MTFHDIQLLLERPAVRLVANPQAAFILGFLFRAFKNNPRVTWPEDDLRVLLENYITERRADDPLAYGDSRTMFRFCQERARALSRLRTCHLRAIPISTSAGIFLRRRDKGSGSKNCSMRPLTMSSGELPPGIERLEDENQRYLRASSAVWSSSRA